MPENSWAGESGVMSGQNGISPAFAVYKKENYMIEKADLIMFMGQSNMAGRGDAKDAPKVKPGAGYEFRAVSSPDRLYPITEPFGKDENDDSGVYEPGMKTGSMVSSFVNAYKEETNTPIVAVSCSKGGSSIAEWIPGTPYYQDVIRRKKRCEDWLCEHKIWVRHRLMVWCQGCTDGDLHTDPDIYRHQTAFMFRSLQKDCRIETCFLIQIGYCRDDLSRYVPIQEAQIKLSEQEKDIILVSSQFASFAEKGLMKDEFHYYQQAYNLVGSEAGKNAGIYIKNALTDE